MSEIGGYQVHPAAEVFPLLDGAEFVAFSQDVKKHGQRDAIVLTREDELLDGRNRLRACLAVGIEPIFDYYDGDDPVAFVLSQNLHRRHLNESQRGVVGARLKPLYEAEAKKRQGQRTDIRTDPSGSSPGRAREHAASAVNVGQTTVAKAEKVLENGIPELVRMVEQGKIRVELAEKLAKRPESEQRAVIERVKAELEKKPNRNPKDIVRRHDKDIIIEGIRNEPEPLPEGPFRVISIDFPWQYEKRPDDSTQRGQTPYPPMTIEEIKAFGEKVEGLAYQDCIIWLWVTNAHLADGVHAEVLKAWGFTKSKTVLTWKKDRMGTGDWLRGITEHAIMAVRGSPVVSLTNQTTEFEAPVQRTPDGHSKKPDRFYEIVESLCPGSKLEMFATEEREGWTSWGLGSSWSASQAAQAP